MSTFLSATPFIDEEKSETIYSFDSKRSIKRSSYHGYIYIAIRPDGTQNVTLNTAIYHVNLIIYQYYTR